MESTPLNNLDFAVVAAYFLLVMGLVGLMLWRERRKSREDDSSGYFLGGRNMGWFVIGASLFASNIGSEHLVGLAGAGASGDFPAGQMEILAALMLLLLGWLFVPFYLRSGVYTMPAFLEKRYNAWARAYLSWISILGYILTKISVTIAAGGVVFTALLGIDFWTGAIITILATGLYTVVGGLKAVLYTDLLQLFVLLGGALAVSYYGLEALGGWDQVAARTSPAYTSLWRSMSDPDFPWTGILLGAPILGVWYWCTDQFIVQRVLAAKNIKEARQGTIFAGYLKLLPLFLFVVPGVIAYALSVGEDPLLVFPERNGAPLYDAALPLMTTQLLPAGLRGLVAAGLLAALMSSLSSVFNSCATLFTFDIYQRYRPQASAAHLVQVGRLSTVILVGLGLAWIPMLELIEGGLYQSLQSIQSYIAPPIAAVFLLGLFMPRLHAAGAQAALLTGAFLGLLRLLLEISGLPLPAGLQWFVAINFLHFALFLFLLCSGVLIAVSYALPATRDETLINTLTLGKGPRSPITSGNVALSILLLLCIGALWYFFA